MSNRDNRPRHRRRSRENHSRGPAFVSRYHRGSQSQHDDTSRNTPLLTRRLRRPQNLSSNLQTTSTPAMHMPMQELPPVLPAMVQTEHTRSQHYIDEMTDTMNDYEYHSARARAAHRRMLQARFEYNSQESSMQNLYNRFVGLSAAADAQTSAELNRETRTHVNRNSFNSVGLVDSDGEDFVRQPTSRPSTLGLRIDDHAGRPNADRLLNLESRRPFRTQRSRPAQVNPAEARTVNVARERTATDVIRTNRRTDRNHRSHTPIATAFATTPLTLTARQSALQDVMGLRNDITRNAERSRAAYQRLSTLRRAILLNRRRLEHLRRERNIFQNQVDRLEVHTFGNQARPHVAAEVVNRNPPLNRAGAETPATALPNSNSANRIVEEVNDMWENFRSRALGAQTQIDESDSDDREQQPTRGNDLEESGSQIDQEERDADSDSELRIEFRTPTMTLKMTNFPQK